jgi:hypothetical protein
MPTVLRTLNLGDNARMKQIVIGLNERDNLTYTLIAERDNADRPATKVEIPLSVAEVDLILKIATFR